MNQTKKRLAIIKLSISMTDTETIQLQVLKLGMLETDSRLKEILSVLSECNYAQAQILISDYIDEDTETTVVQRSSSKENMEVTMSERKRENLLPQDANPLLTLKEKIQQAKDKAIIKQFELFSNISQKETSEEIDDSSTYLNTTPKPKEDIAPLVEKELKPLTKISNTEEFIEKEMIDEKKVEVYFKAIPYIEQKFKNMQIQYPPVHESGKYFTSVDNWLFKISTKGYTESEVEAMIKQVENLNNTNKAEAAKLLLINAATESKYAHFRLARALYKGELLQKNLPESFTLINRLAVSNDYPEAICDLAQFYEHGIGIKKDKKKAELLYKEAMDLGIHRAMKHYERIRKANKGFFSFNT